MNQFESNPPSSESEQGMKNFISLMSLGEEAIIYPDSGLAYEGMLDGTALRERLAVLVPMYRAAFAGWPFYERSVCPEECGLADYCGAEPGEVCDRSGFVPTEPAYDETELAERFWELTEDEAIFAVEYADYPPELPLMAAEMRPLTAKRIASEKYLGQQPMAEWLTNRLGDSEVLWREEVFADTDRRAKGNLAYYGLICRAIAEREGFGTLVGRTINPRLLGKLLSEFGPNLTIYAPEFPVLNGVEMPERVNAVAEQTVPDDRFLAIIELGQEI